MEIAIVMMVIGVVLAGIWLGMGKLNEKARAADAVNEIHSITQGMTSLLRSGYGTNPAAPPCGAAAPPCDITGNMINAGVIPLSYQSPGGATASNPWNPIGLRIYWMGATAIIPNPLTYRLSLFNISLPGCLGVVSQMMNCTTGQPGCPDLAFGTTITYSNNPQPLPAVFSVPGTLTTLPLPFTSVDTQAICASNTYPGPPNSIEWDFSQ